MKLLELYAVKRLGQLHDLAKQAQFNIAVENSNEVPNKNRIDLWDTEAKEAESEFYQVLNILTHPDQEAAKK